MAATREKPMAVDTRPERRLADKEKPAFAGFPCHAPKRTRTSTRLSRTRPSNRVKRVRRGGNRPHSQLCRLGRTSATVADVPDVLTMFSARTARTIGEKPATADATVDRGREEIIVMENLTAFLDERLDRSESVPTLLRPSDVAARLGVSRTWLYDAAKDGRIPSIRLGAPDGPLRFAPDDLRDWIDENRAAWRPGRVTAARGASPVATARPRARR